MSAEAQARFITLALFGDEEWEAPDGRKAWEYFASLPTETAWAEFRQMRSDYDFWDRPRDLLERMGEDGA
jgi:hypothetical protein